jgi:hypothetical protein
MAMDFIFFTWYNDGWTYRLDGQGLIPSRGNRYLLHNIQPGSGAHPPSYLISRGSLPRGKAAGARR